MGDFDELEATLTRSMTFAVKTRAELTKLISEAKELALSASQSIFSSAASVQIWSKLILVSGLYRQSLFSSQEQV